jgi:hypothetical protein
MFSFFQQNMRDINKSSPTQEVQLSLWYQFLLSSPHDFCYWSRIFIKGGI